MKLFCTFLILLSMLMPVNAQESAAPATGEVIEMDDLMFRYRIIDYKSELTEWNYKGEKPCIIDFYATWCAPCRMISPILKEIAKEYKDEIWVYKIDVDKQKELASAMGIQSLPTILFIPQKGNPQMIVGAADKATFHRAVKQVLLNKDEE